MFSLETRRLRGQLIEVFKILQGFDSVDYRDIFQLSKGRTRNHGYKLELKRYNRDLCGNFFTYRICGALERTSGRSCQRHYGGAVQV